MTGAFDGMLDDSIWKTQDQIQIPALVVMVKSSFLSPDYEAFVRDLVPGVDVPESALAIMYDADLAIPGRVTIGYGTSCDSAPPFVTLPVSAEAGRITRRVAGHAPAGITLPQGGAQVRVQVYFDFDGLPHFPAYTGGPGALADAAVAAVAEFRAEPPRVNGAPILQLSTIAVAFPESSGR